MKKKQQKKKNTGRTKKSSNKLAIQNIDKKLKTSTVKKPSSTGIPKYVADRMARRIFFTAGIPTIMGMSVFVVSYVINEKYC